MSLEILQIVPRLPPAINGVGDYAYLLARQLRAAHNIHTRFLVCDPSWEGELEIEAFSVEKLQAQQATELTEKLSKKIMPQTVLLHYVGYGYEKRGCPFWLKEGLEAWRKSNANHRLVVMFHELYASGPFWTSAFWLSSLQKRLAASIARLSDSCLTNRQAYAETLKALSHNKHSSIATLPVFSNVGEPEQIPLPLKDRKRRLIVFGSDTNRLRVYKESLSALELICRALAIVEIFDVGPPMGLSISNINSTPVIQTGQRSAVEITALLSDAVAGFFNYNPAFLAKSGIFAAYSAHRLIPITAQCNGSRADDLELGKHYWAANSHDEILSQADWQEIADNAYAWYQTHKLSKHVKTFASLVGYPND